MVLADSLAGSRRHRKQRRRVVHMHLIPRATDERSDANAPSRAPFGPAGARTSSGCALGPARGRGAVPTTHDGTKCICTRRVMHRLLTPAEVGGLVGLKRDAIYRAIEAGELKAVRLRGRLRTREEWVEEWVQASVVRSIRPRAPSGQPQRSRPRVPSDSVRAQLRKERST
jgi:excisionase family DNA binding protein